VTWYRLAQAELAAGNRDAQQRALAEFRKVAQLDTGWARETGSGTGSDPTTDW